MIQNLEQYFAAARSPIEHMTELAISYLKGPAIQWWRGTGYAPSNVPWHKFCSYLSERFSVESACDVVSNFHAAHQTTTIAAYVEHFEQLVNGMRRENPAIPNDYYVSNFVSGLNPYIRSLVDCFKPEDLQTAVWYARRMEKSQPPSQSVQNKQYVPQPRRQVLFEQPKPLVANATPNRNVIIQQAKQNQVCYKCREPWVPGHRQVCKMNRRAQIQALHAQEEGNPETIYVADYDDNELDNIEQLTDETLLKVSMHAAMGIGDAKNTFILIVKLGNTLATTLVDSGSTTTFISPQMASKLNVTPSPTPKTKVVVASGGILWSEF